MKKFSNTVRNISWFKVAYVVLVIITMFVIVSFIYLLLSFSGSSSSNEDGFEPGLYNESTDAVKVLNVNNFENNVLNSSSSWLVQFYNSWCGHCINFSPIYKKFAAGVNNWKSVVKIAAVNCADDKNTQLCRDYEIMVYPTMKYFHPFIWQRDVLGTNFAKLSSISSMRHRLVTLLEESETGGWSIHSWPKLAPIVNETSVNEILTGNNVSADELFFLVVESEDSYAGRELILDTMFVERVKMRRMLNGAELDVPAHLKPTLLPTVYAMNRDGVDLLQVTNSGREPLYELVIEYANRKLNLNLPTKLDTSEQQPAAPLSTERPFNRTDRGSALSNNVYLTDLENAVRYSLFHEIPLKPFLDKEARLALYRYLDVLSKFFPFKPNSEPFIVRLKEFVWNKTDEASFSGEDFRTTIGQLERAHSPLFATPGGWYGCQGSSSKYRGYPCGLWMLAHTLTVRSDSADGTEVLTAFEGYIKHFFGCNECSENFLKMSSSIRTNVTTRDDAILWLWRAHNMVNKRLKGEPSEDPSFPKMQFPPEYICANCRHPNGTWNDEEILKFLRFMYLRIMYFIPNEDSLAELHAFSRVYDRHTALGSPPSSFNLSDANIGVALYILFMLVLVAYVIKVVVIRKKPKSKHNTVSDNSIFNKV